MTSPGLDRRALFGLAGAAAGLLLFGQSPGTAASMRFAVTRTPAQWKQQLGAQRYHILREAGTETAFTSPLLKEHRRGTFTCAGCGLPLFSSVTKFESGTGGPSFWRPLARAVVERPDPHDRFAPRTEVLCARCGGHLGHVFDDGPRPTGLRYCMNGLALSFRPA
jgi:peptide-methionine (R)-S-oxide reductase